MARYLVNQVVGNMTVKKQLIGKITKKGLIPYYLAVCNECGRQKEISHDALRKRQNTKAIKCGSCAQDGKSKLFTAKGKLDASCPDNAPFIRKYNCMIGSTTYEEIGFPMKLHQQFMMADRKIQ